MIAPVDVSFPAWIHLLSHVQIADVGARLGSSAAGLSRLEEYSAAEYVSSLKFGK